MIQYIYIHIFIGWHLPIPCFRNAFWEFGLSTFSHCLSFHPLTPSQLESVLMICPVERVSLCLHWGLEDFLPCCINVIHTHSLTHICTYWCITTCWTPAHTDSTQNDRKRSAIVLPLDWYRDSDDSRRTVGAIPNHTQGSTTSETSWIILCRRGHVSLQKKPSLISCFIFFRHYHSFLSSEKKKKRKNTRATSVRERTPEDSPVGLNLMHSLSVDFLFSILHWHDEQNSECVFKVE